MSPHPTRIYCGKLYYRNEEIRYIDSTYRMYNPQTRKDEVLGEICVGTNTYPIWLNVEDVAEMLTW